MQQSPRDQELRIEALRQAINAHGNVGGNPDNLVEAAEKYYRFLVRKDEKDA